VARAVRNSKTDSRSARVKLPPQPEPYWTKISKGCFVGYRKGAKGGTWIARYRARDAKQRYRALGAADDAMDADGIQILDFAQAQATARDWFERQSRIDAGRDAEHGPFTVKDAIELYMLVYSAEGKGVRNTNYSINAHIIPALGHLEVQELTTARLRQWRDNLAASPPRLRSALGEEPAYRAAPDGPDAIRRRRSTANRVLTILKAALNHAWNEGRVPSDNAWRRVKPFRGADSVRIRYLTEGECKRLVNAADPDLRPMIQAALLTGCRYSELASLAVGDFNVDAGAIHIRTTKSGRPRHVILTADGQSYFDRLTAGRDPEELIFKKANGKPWGRSHQVRPLRLACERAKIKPPVNFHALRHTYASHAVMGNVPLQVVADNLGHADTRMVEKHYGHLAPSYKAERIRAGTPTLGIVEKDHIEPFRTGSR